MLAFAEVHQSFSFPTLYSIPCLSKRLWGGSIFLNKILLKISLPKQMCLILKDIVLQMGVLNWAEYYKDISCNLIM